MARIVLLLALALAACDVAAPVPAPPAGAELTARQAADAFLQVVQRVEPVAERECRKRTAGVNCDFRIAVDRNPRATANAFQSLDAAGRPVVVFTVGLIAEARNADEMAFVLGHEAAHHIAGHLERQAQDAAAGAAIFAGIVTLTGGSAREVAEAEQAGAIVGARSYSKEYELEADYLGTIIAAHAGYDPRQGAKYFTRIPDPGNRFLGTHPPNAARLDAVGAALRDLGRV